MEEKNQKTETEEKGIDEETPAAEETVKSGEKSEKTSKHDAKQLKAENEKLASEIKSLTEKSDELTDRYTRMLAEYDNFRKRVQKEKEGTYSDAVCDTLSQILPIKDSLEMAMAFADDGKLSQGVTMTLNKFNEILEKLGVEAFGEKGDSFDPNLHNAIFHVEDENFGENEIVEVLLKGYKKGDKILRYAMVKVAN